MSFVSLGPPILAHKFEYARLLMVLGVMLENRLTINSKTSECFKYFGNIDLDLAVRSHTSGIVLRGCPLDYRFVCKLMLLTTYLLHIVGNLPPSSFNLDDVSVILEEMVKHVRPTYPMIVRSRRPVI